MTSEDGQLTAEEHQAIRQGVRRAQALDSFLRREDRDDLYQVCLEHWFRKRKTYLVGGASVIAVLRTVVRNHLLNVSRDLQRDRRKTMSLADPLEPG